MGACPLDAASSAFTRNRAVCNSWCKAQRVHFEVLLLDQLGMLIGRAAAQRLLGRRAQNLHQVPLCLQTQVHTI